jgi:predicted DNA-binding transcriptional regulator YafY
MNTIDILTEAIKEKKVVEFNYKWEGIRKWNPHAIYKHGNTENIILDLYQVSWYSSTYEKIPWWREFSIENISSVNILNETFNVNDWYNTNSDRYKNSIIKI